MFHGKYKYSFVVVNLQKVTLSLIKILLVLMKKPYWMNFKIQRISKGGKVNKLRLKLFDQN